VELQPVVNHSSEGAASRHRGRIIEELAEKQHASRKYCCFLYPRFRAGVPPSKVLARQLDFRAGLPPP
jgi:hypothetical protein